METFPAAFAVKRKNAEEDFDLDRRAPKYYAKVMNIFCYKSKMET